MIEINKKEQSFLFNLITTQIMKQSSVGNMRNYVLMKGLYDRLSTTEELSES